MQKLTSYLIHLVFGFLCATTLAAFASVALPLIQKGSLHPVLIHATTAFVYLLFVVITRIRTPLPLHGRRARIIFAITGGLCLLKIVLQPSLFVEVLLFCIAWYSAVDACIMRDVYRNDTAKRETMFANMQ